jgi:hypothetical protein
MRVSKNFIAAMVAMIALAGALTALGLYLRLPIVQQTADGTCVRVLFMDEYGREIMPCSAIDLVHDRYETEVVLSAREKEALLRAQTTSRFEEAIVNREHIEVVAP